MYAFENCLNSVGIVRFAFVCFERQFYELDISLLAQMTFQYLHLLVISGKLYRQFLRQNVGFKWYVQQLIRVKLQL